MSIPTGARNRAPDADDKLGTARARTRIYSFGAGGDGGGCGGHREDIFRATAVDDARRRQGRNRGNSTARDSRPGKRVAGVSVGAAGRSAMPEGRAGAAWPVDVDRNEADENDEGVDSKHFGVVDISKVRSMPQASAMMD